jgi:hypothetical protein
VSMASSPNNFFLYYMYTYTAGVYDEKEEIDADGM